MVRTDLHTRDFLHRSDFNPILHYKQVWLEILQTTTFETNEYFPDDFETIIDLCVDDGFPGDAHGEHMYGVDEEGLYNISDGALISRLETLLRKNDVHYQNHGQRSDSGDQYVFDLKNFTIEKRKIEGDKPDIVSELAQGRTQITINEIDGTKTLTDGTPGDVYASHVKGAGPAFGVPFDPQTDEGIDPYVVMGLRLALVEYSGNVKDIVVGAHLKCGLAIYNATADREFLESHAGQGKYFDGQRYHERAFGELEAFDPDEEVSENNPLGYPARELAFKMDAFLMLTEAIYTLAATDDDLQVILSVPYTVNRQHDVPAHIC